MSKTQILVANLNALRDAGAVTINELAERSGLHRVTISMILNGRQKGLTLDNAAAIASATGFPLEQLIAGPIEVTTTV